MSQVAIRTALEAALQAMTPVIVTAWENVSFTPPSGTTPYQEAHVMFATPDNAVYGSAFQELGIFQVRLSYPLNQGPKPASVRAELLRTTFARGKSFTSDGITTIINRTPEVMPAMAEGGRYSVVVKIRFYANIN